MDIRRCTNTFVHLVYVSNYKFQGFAYFDTKDNNSLGIYLRLCVGLLDDSLKWHFLGKVTITLINLQNSDNSVTNSYTTEGKDVFTRRERWNWNRIQIICN